MIKNVKVTNHLGETLLLEPRSPEQSGLYIRDIKGLGPAKSVVNVTEVLASDGSFYNSSRIGSRDLIFDLGFYPDGLESIETIRQKTYRAFSMKRSIHVEVETDNRIGYTDGYVESNEPDVFSNSEGTIISMLCPSAFWYSVDVVRTVFNGSNASFEFPWENTSTINPTLEFGTIFINAIQSVVYGGDETTGVEITATITGNVNNLTFYNETANQVMAIDSGKLAAMTGSDLVAGDIIHISTAKGKKHIHLIRNGNEINILNALGTSVQWFTIDRGDNLFTYTAASGVANVSVLIEHRIIYRGL